MRDRSTWLLVLFIAIAAGCSLLAVLFVPLLDFDTSPAAPAPIVAAVDRRDRLLPEPGDAPPALRPFVLRGHAIVESTHRALGSQIRSSLDCSHCHFRAGLTETGKNGGIPLVGAAARFPRAVGTPSRLVDLPSRINRCLVENLQAPPLPHDSPAMHALLAYHHWIAAGTSLSGEPDWRPWQPVAAETAPDAARGAHLFLGRCAPCHGRDGAGTPIAPAVWGPRSFTTASEMTEIEYLAMFVFYNMPRQSPDLSPGPAYDVAAFVAGRPRPSPPAGESAETAEP